MKKQDVLSQFKFWHFLVLFLLHLNAEATTVMGYINTEFDVPNYEQDKKGKFNTSRVAFLFQHEVNKYKFLSEVEYANTPGINATGTNQVGATEKTSTGEITVERAWAEITFGKTFNIKIGKENTPTLWLRNHYPNIAIPATDPQLIGAIFHEYYIGAEAYGKFNSGFHYSVWTGNSEPALKNEAANPATDPANTDHGIPDDSPTPLSSGVKLGWKKDFGDNSIDISLLGAKYLDVEDDGTDDRTNPSGAEINLTFKKFNLWFEAHNGKNKKGHYLILSYSIPGGTESEYLPYFTIDSLTDNTGDAESGKVSQAVTRNGIGLVYKPVPTIATKIEYLKTPKVNDQISMTELSFQFIYFFM